MALLHMFHDEFIRVEEGSRAHLCIEHYPRFSIIIWVIPDLASPGCHRSPNDAIPGAVRLPGISGSPIGPHSDLMRSDLFPGRAVVPHRFGLVPGHHLPPLSLRSLLPGRAVVRADHPQVPGHFASPVLQSSLLPGGAVVLRRRSAIPGHLVTPSALNRATSRWRCRAASSRCRPRSCRCSSTFCRTTSRWRCRGA